jgi:hypothetical protein
MANPWLWMKRREEPKPRFEWPEVLENVERDQLLLDDDELFREMAQDTGPVKHVHETIASSLESYEGKKKRLEQDLARVKEELRQTEVTIRALSQAFNILGTDIASNGSITFEV